jgi:Ca2+-transporting ATPase
VPVMFGWPMLLMPVHILFLQLIIDPACSVVFEAEPLEADAMKVSPRRPDARLFDKTVLVRGLWQGAGLLVVLLAVFSAARELSKSDDVARAMTFSVLVLSNIGLIFTNRFWSEPALKLRAEGRPSNSAFIWSAAATLVMLAVILGVPAICNLFSFASPPPLMLLFGFGAALLSLFWFEAVKWGLGLREAT